MVAFPVTEEEAVVMMVAARAKAESRAGPAAAEAELPALGHAEQATEAMAVIVAVEGSCTRSGRRRHSESRPRCTAGTCRRGPQSAFRIRQLGSTCSGE